MEGYKMRLYRAKDYNDMSRKAAHIISAQVIMKPDCVLGLATGSTPIGTYKQLIEWYNNGDLDFAEVKTANLDEYKGLTRDNDQSYYYFMHENLFKHVNIKEENTNIPDGTEPDAAKECARYENVVHELGGVDLQLLGLGHNGHIGFNEPGSDDTTITRQVHLDELTRSDAAPAFGGIENVPTTAITMGVATIMGAREVALMAWGEKKASIVKKAVQGPVTVDVTASYLQKHPNARFLLDKGAASQL